MGEIGLKILLEKRWTLPGPSLPLASFTRYASSFYPESGHWRGERLTKDDAVGGSGGLPDQSHGCGPHLWEEDAHGWSRDWKGQRRSRWQLLLSPSPRPLGPAPAEQVGGPWGKDALSSMTSVECCSVPDTSVQHGTQRCYR